MLTSAHSPGHRLALADTNVVPPAQCPFPSSKFCSTEYSARPEISCSTIDVFRLLRFRFSCLMMTTSRLARAMVGPLCFIRKPTVCNTLMKKGSAFRNIEQSLTLLDQPYFCSTVFIHTYQWPSRQFIPGNSRAFAQ